MISGSAAPIDPFERVKPGDSTSPPRVRRDRAKAPAETKNSLSKDSVELGADDLHSQDGLRDTAAKLMASGDINISADGAVRPDRITAARRNVDRGTYSRRDVIAGIVDRLLEHWQI
ncbi:MAG: hypothetical protein AB1792_03270 [Candidatus Zixiibacteriota bacterium]